MKEVRDSTAEILDGTTLEDLIRRSQRLSEAGQTCHVPYLVPTKQRLTQNLFACILIY